VKEVELSVVDLVGVEGPGWLLPDLSTRWMDAIQRAHVLNAARAVEREPSLLGLSAHLMVVARKLGSQ